MSKKSAVVISGQIVRNENPSLMSFWMGFINIQRSLNDLYDYDFFVHSWNPEYQDLVTSVYNPKKFLHEKQKNFLGLYISKISKIDKLENKLNRSSSVWKNCSFQNILGLSISRSKSVNLLKKYKIDYDWAIFARWDQGVSGTGDVNKIIFDPCLSNNYIYMSYYREIDEGYADMWMVSNTKNALLFSNYYKFVIKCLTENNKYLYYFNNKWPISNNNSNHDNLKNKIKLSILYKLSNLLSNKFFLKLGKFFNNYFPVNNSYFYQITNKVFLTAENSLINDFSQNIDDYSSKTSWPLFKAINNHAILKYFFLSMKKRKFLRFLNNNDFEKINNKGKLINKINYSFVIYSHSSYSDCWDMAVKQTFKHTPKYDGVIYLLTEDSPNSKRVFNNLFKESQRVVLITYTENLSYTKRLEQCLRKIKSNIKYIYFFHEDMPLYGDVDEEYLNALLHYLNFSNDFYIKLVDTTKVNQKSDNYHFPNLVTNNGGFSLSVQPSVIKLELFLEFLTAFDNSIYEFEEIIYRSNLIFSAVKGSKKIGKYTLVNKNFPHIATAIFKGKWCISEWKKQLLPLLDDYDIDHRIRGSV